MMISVHWPCDSVVPSKKCEVAVSKVIHRRGEVGRGRDLPQHRLDEISASCEANGMTLFQALSLRRSKIRSFPGGMRPSRLAISHQGQQHIATLFEEAVESFLRSATSSNSNVFLTEVELRAEMRAGTRPQAPTPDILFLQPVSINGQTVNWIDAKLYYASAMYAMNKKIPNGKIRDQAQRFNRHYGKGAFVFGQGFCADLASIVPDALLLDATPLDMSAVNAFQNEST